HDSGQNLLQPLIVFAPVVSGLEAGVVDEFRMARGLSKSLPKLRRRGEMDSKGETIGAREGISLGGPRAADRARRFSCRQALCGGSDQESQGGRYHGGSDAIGSPCAFPSVESASR